MAKLFLGGGDIFINGEKVGTVVSGEVETIDPVEVVESTRWGMGYDYQEKYYHCPKCGKLLAYHNGVKLISGNMKQNFCSNCGYELNWNVKEKLR